MLCRREFARRSTVLLMPCLLALVAVAACVHTPPEVMQAHRQEADVVDNLQKAHISMVDAYIKEKRESFDQFFFASYTPTYVTNWKKRFKEINKRDYDESRDVGALSNDLVAEYQDLSAPLDKMQRDFYAAINTEYGNARQLHNGVGDWIQSVQNLNDSQRAAINRVLSVAKPGLTVDSITQTVDQAIARVKSKLPTLTN